MANIAWLAAPYVSMWLIFRSGPLARAVAGHTALTLPIGWIAVLALLAGLLHLWEPPVVLMAVCAALSGLSMISQGPDPGDDDDDPEPDDEPPPLIDWDAFDAARRDWQRGRTPRPPRSPTPA